MEETVMVGASQSPSAPGASGDAIGASHAGALKLRSRKRCLSALISIVDMLDICIWNVFCF